MKNAGLRSRMQAPASRLAACDPARRERPAASWIEHSPFMVTQRRKLEELTGGEGALPAHPAASGQGLPASLRGGLESLSGIDLSDVRVHTASSKPAQLQAHAYAQGSDIHLAPGQEQHLPHEAWHLVQQRQGRVAATGRVGGVAVNDDQALETEADRMGARAAQGSAAPAWQQVPASAPPAAVAQLKKLKEWAFGGPNVTPHIHTYPSGAHVKLAGGTRYNLVTGGVKVKDERLTEIRDAIAEQYPVATNATRVGLLSAIDEVLSHF